ncbi:MAG: lipid-A-disaccharide synthase [Candidatus Sedimenticola sp. (ex Thyasira tokunagai)]
MLRIGIVANEPSGDLLGAGLIREIRNRCPDASFEGVGGPLMEAQGCRSLFLMERLSVMGLAEVLKHLPELLSIRRQLLAHFKANPPDLFIGVDAPDFNLGLERRLKSAGIPTVHYVSPTVWAWRPKRVKKIRKAVDLMLSIFPFEVDFLKQHRVPVVFVGHPLADEIPLESSRSKARERVGLEQAGRVIALMPGSRMSEIHSLSEVFLKTAERCLKQYPELKFLVPMVNERTHEAFTEYWKSLAPELPLILLKNGARDAMEAADLVLTASGTATLEGMLIKRPMVVAYRLSRFTYWLVNTFNLVKIPYVAMANLLAGEELAPEYIQDAATPEALSSAIIKFLNSPEQVAQIERRYATLHQEMRQDSSSKAAEAVLQLIKPRILS